MPFSPFWCTVSITSTLPEEGPLVVPSGPKTNYMVNFSKTIQPQERFWISNLNRACNTKNFDTGGNPLGVAPTALEPFVFQNVWFLIVSSSSLFWDTISIVSILPSGGNPGPKTQLSVKFQ